MLLQELLASPPGQLIKGFHNIRVDYIDGIKTNINSPSFDGWNLPSQMSRQSFGFCLVKDFSCEDKLKCANRRFDSPEKCLAILTDKKMIDHNAEVLEENKEYAQNFTIVKVTTDDTLPMLIGDYFATLPAYNASVPDNFLGKIYAKVIIGDKIGWVTFTILTGYHLEIT